MDSRASERFERSGTVVDPRQSLAMWLRAGRARRQLSLDEVARVTKIQPRILEKLESGHFDGLPAEVFVKGFVRSVARCLGLDEAEALARYGECVAPGTAKARAFVEVMAPAPVPVPAPRIIAPPEPEPAPEPEPVRVVATPVAAAPEPQPAAAAPDPAPAEAAPAAPSQTAGKKKRRRGGKNRKKRATETPVTAASPADDAHVAEPVIAEGSGRIDAPVDELAAATDSSDPAPAASDAPTAPTAPWKPTMPPLPASSPPWRRPALATMAPSLVIDDEDPDRAEREQEARETAARDQRVSFLPPILLDRDRGGQGGLTLAVIILLIAATLTLSYLMRRPSVRGDGVTMTHATPVEMV